LIARLDLTPQSQHPAGACRRPAPAWFIASSKVWMEPRLPPATAFGDVMFEPVSGELHLDGQTQRLRPQTAAVLAQLLLNAGRLVSRDDLLKAVWGDVLVTENSVTQCIAEIRRAFGPARESWLKTNARRGYQLDAPAALSNLGNPAAVIDPPTPQAPAATSAAANVSPPHSRPRVGMVWVAVAAALVLVLAAWWGWRTLRPGPVGQLSLAVLPFELAGSNAETAWFAEIVGEDITFNLARIPGARVVSRVSTQAYPARGVDLRRVGTDLDVRYVVAGSVERDGDRVTLRMQLIDVATGALRWSERLDSTLTALHDAEREVANRVANALHVKLVDEESARIRRVDPSSPAAEDLALQAWAAWNRGTPAEVSRARELAQRALELNDRSVIAWKTMASWHLRARINQTLPAEQAEAGAEQAANRALAIDPDHPLVHTVWGAVQVLRGRYVEGQKALEHEIRTNPSHPVAYSYLGIAHLMLGQPELAIDRYRQALSISPRDPRLSRFERHMALSFLHKGELSQAVTHARSATRAPQVDRAAWAVLAGVCAVAGDTPCIEDARAGLRKSWPNVSVAMVESEWPPQTAAFRQQHEAFVRGLTQVLAMP
jgi:TolB-like protein/DNA-binding winged helix-turn-helix (wHTH) protein